MKVLVIGAGMMAKAASFDFVNNKTITEIKIVSHNLEGPEKIKEFLNSEKVSVGTLDASNEEEAAKVMQDYDVALSCVPYLYNFGLAKAAIKSKTNFVDLGGNNDIVKQELSLNDEAKEAGILIVPDCGLAPGLVSVLTKKLIDELGEVDEIHLRVGGLPLTPNNPPLNYELVFSVKGLINEYIEPVTVIRDSKKEIIDSLTEIEELEFPEPFGKMEAFTTSGGTSTLPETYEGKIKSLDYKTIRYKGHVEEIKRLMKEFPENIEEKLLEILPKGKKDVVLIKAWAIKDNKKVEYEIIEEYDDKTGLTAMMRMTGFPVAILCSMIGNEITEKGAMTQENFVPAEKILEELKLRGIKIKNP